jgi:hypothetical protein
MCDSWNVLSNMSGLCSFCLFLKQKNKIADAIIKAAKRLITIAISTPFETVWCASGVICPVEAAELWLVLVRAIAEGNTASPDELDVTKDREEAPVKYVVVNNATDDDEPPVSTPDKVDIDVTEFELVIVNDELSIVLLSADDGTSVDPVAIFAEAIPHSAALGAKLKLQGLGTQQPLKPLEQS